MNQPPATMEIVIEAIFDALGDQGERDGDQFVIPSGYGSGPMIINVRQVAVELMKTFDIAEKGSA